ncbi:polysaccharide deacetylase family protein [Actinomadura roseirufa]|uniref:polysaccharide deacetylase family protein n=1 Tax=Actinomadura roseirufa TaxID=2094049 RepID=UPI0010419C8D|nr:polysaccharide deacetylase family protein [Actinomadura roseirufa]
MPPPSRTIALLVSLLASLIAVPALAAAPAGAATGTVVSLTFDDGAQDHYDNARPALDAHGMKGTFYINSGRVGSSGYMDRTEIAGLAAGGHEIGGHTISHADLPTLATAEQQRQVCDDRVALLNMGFTVKNFAYPYGNADSGVEKVVRDCGYNSARTVGGVVSPGSCSGCGYSETIPPADAYFTQTPDSIKTGTTVADLKGYVTQAENHGGGWVQLVIHHVCEGCDDTYAVSPTTLNQFLDWLQPRAAQGTTVKTVDQVIGGSLQPPVQGPPSPLTVQNPSLEAATNGVPNCFQLGGYGTNTFTWTRTNDSHTGQYAERVDITARTDGDRKLVTRQDAGTCAPAASPGHTYKLGVWYKGSWGSGVTTKMSIYYRNAAGVWTFWTNGPTLAATSTWQRTLVTTPAVPAGATNLSFGVALPGVGSLTVDDFTLTDEGP